MSMTGRLERAKEGYVIAGNALRRCRVTSPGRGARLHKIVLILVQPREPSCILVVIERMTSGFTTNWSCFRTPGLNFLYEPLAFKRWGYSAKKVKHEVSQFG